MHTAQYYHDKHHINTDFVTLLEQVQAPSLLCAHLVIEALVRDGVRDFFVASGSRSAPLVSALEQADMRHAGLLSVHTHVDERALGFMALGYAQACERVAVVITTSGSAVANLLPAVVEAKQAGAALLLLTADRPPELIDCAANQAIRQVGIFGDYVAHCEHIVPLEAAASLTRLLASVDYCHALTLRESQPVHMNLMFREPLYEARPSSEALSAEDAFEDALLEKHLSEQDLRRETSLFSRWGAPESVVDWACHTAPFTHYLMMARDETLQEIAFDLPDKTLIYLGQSRALKDPQVRKQVAATLERLGLPVIADIAFEYALYPHSCFVRHFGHLAEHAPALLAEAEALVCIGKPPTTAPVLQWFKQNKVKAYYHISETIKREDPFFTCATHLIGSVSAVLAQASVTHEYNAWSKQVWQEDKRLGTQLPIALADVIDAAVPNEISADTATELLCLRSLATALSACEAQSWLFLGNSLPIRLFDMLAMPAQVRVFTQRGASGIDGTLSHAIGLALADRNRHVFAVVGDLAALHDLNALLALKRLAIENITFLLLNNDGGNLFDFLSAKTHIGAAFYENAFAMTHGVRFNEMAVSMGLKCAVLEGAEPVQRLFAEGIDAIRRYQLIEVCAPSGGACKTTKALTAQLALRFESSD